MKKVCTGLLLGCMLLGISSPSYGFLYWTTDRFRSLAGIIASIIGLTGDGESKAQLIAQQEENNKKACGGAGSADATNTDAGKLGSGSAAGSEFPGSAFDYVNTYVLSKGGAVEYAPLKKALASTDDQNTVREEIRKTVLTFFADPDKADQTTTEYKNQLRQNRNEYAREASTRHVTLAYQVKGHIQNDLSAISSAAVSGDGELGSIAVDAHTLEQMVKMELVDLALQIETMEADAIQFLMDQPIELMPKTKPTN